MKKSAHAHTSVSVNIPASRLISPLLHSTALTLGLTAASLLSMTSAAHAIDDLELPTGGTVVGGSANLNYGAPGQLDVNQSSDRAVIDWNTFNIGEKATTTFNQPGTTALTVNRVTGDGQDPAQILGTLRANGRVVILDRNGVLFGKNSRVDTAGIIASTGDMKTEQVMAGSERLELSNMGTGTVENRGTITVSDSGLAALVAPTVRNSGTINARLGRVALASGEKVTVDLYGDKLVEIALDEQTSKAVIEQTGTLSAEGGSIEITAAAAKDAVDSVINMKGITTASSVSSKGGSIVLSADTINIDSSAKISANSAAGQAAGTVKAVARTRATVAGTLEATGAEDTGFVETSAAKLDFADTAKVSTTGEWLIDPTDITVDATLETLIESALATGNVNIVTPSAGADAGNIYVDRTIDWSSNNTLAMVAANDILFGTPTSGLNATGAATIVLSAGRNVGITAGSGISTNGGHVAVLSNRFLLTSGSINANGGNILINNKGGFDALANSIMTTGTGTITLHQNKDSDAFLTSNTIQNAINSVNNSGTGTNTVMVGAGTYNESVVIDRTLNLLGANYGKPATGTRVAESVIAPTSGTGITASASDVLINGFKVDGGIVGIALNNYSNLRALNNIVSNTEAYGISAYGTYGSLIQGNAVSQTGIGIDVMFSSDVSVSGNTVTDASQNGIRSIFASDISLLGNTIRNTGESGVYMAYVSYMNVIGNKISQSKSGHGVEGYNGYDTSVMGNTISGVKQTGVNLGTMYGTTQINGNTISKVGAEGIKTNYVSDLLIAGNTITSTGADGILVENSYNEGGKGEDDGGSGEVALLMAPSMSGTVTLIAGNTISDTKSPENNRGSGIHVRNSQAVTVYGNNISNTGWDGVRLDSGSNVDVVANTMKNVHRTGIYFTGLNNLQILNNSINTAGIRYGIDGNNGSETTISDNSIDTTARSGINLWNLIGSTIVTGNKISNSGTDGISSTAVDNLEVGNNTVSRVAKSGLHVIGPVYTNSFVYGNAISDAAVGMTFESGLIDLTGDTNTISNTGVGLRFAPVIVKGGFTQVDLAGNTIGTTTFSNQTGYYVELLNGALFAPGTPTIEDGLSATYDGFSPLSVGGILTAAQLATLEGKFWHYMDDDTLGLFFFGTNPDLPVNRVFRQNLLGFVPGPGAAGFTITGLPRLPGAGGNTPPTQPTNPADLNALSPAAGPGAQGNLPGNPTPQDVAAVQPAAGPADASCWSDAANLAGTGYQVNYNFSSDPAAAMNDASRCGSSNNPL